eukprot:TRINITY_DN29233_c0_g1_i1.p2 TRINITY_DN29233_c0_g1~~TRINITY_DN29233_c0_g1_i1.p2  ORF type:complete len:489 (+),score=157.50 TRINITY_DN29233_c0_g1_i1:74-1468(+)
MLTCALLAAAAAAAEGAPAAGGAAARRAAAGESVGRDADAAAAGAGEGRRARLRAWAAAVAASGEFRKRLWERGPHVFRSAAGGMLEGALTLERVLQMADRGEVSADANANSFFDPASRDDGRFVTAPWRPAGGGATLSRADITAGLGSAGLLMSHAEAAEEFSADAAGAFADAFGFVTGANVYVTMQGSRIAAPPHTDRTDSFILQTEGCKRWRVRRPSIMLPVWGIHGSGQWGKSGKRLPSGHGGKLLLDRTLHPGDVLWIPRGMVHETSTPESCNDSCPAGGSCAAGASVSITLSLLSETLLVVNEKLLRCAAHLDGRCGPGRRGPEGRCEGADAITAAARRHLLLRRVPNFGFLNTSARAASRAVRKGFALAGLEPPPKGVRRRAARRMARVVAKCVKHARKWHYRGSEWGRAALPQRQGAVQRALTNSPDCNALEECLGGTFADRDHYDPAELRGYGSS